MTNPPESIDEYLASLPDEARVALSTLRQQLRLLIPGYEEIVSYRIPIFKYRGKQLVGFAAFKNHLSFMTMSPALMIRIQDIVKPYLNGATALHFTHERPLPDDLVAKIVRARIEEVESVLNAKKSVSAGKVD